MTARSNFIEVFSNKEIKYTLFYKEFCIVLRMMSENSVFGLTEEEAAELDSKDEYFYGFTNDDNHLSCNEVNISILSLQYQYMY